MDAFIGMIMLWPLTYAPAGWALCDGSMLLVSQYQALFSLIGYTYGGDGKNNFALPDLRCRLPVGAPAVTGVGAYSPAHTNPPQPFAPSATIGTPNLPAHTHTATFNPTGGASQVSIAIPAVAGNTSHLTTTPGTTVSLAQTSTNAPDPTNIYSTDAPDTTLKPFQVSVPAGGGTITVTPTGGGQPTPVTIPYLTLNYIIAIDGIYPVRP